jgi:hypothetical protein
MIFKITFLLIKLLNFYKIYKYNSISKINKYTHTRKYIFYQMFMIMKMIQSQFKFIFMTIITVMWHGYYIMILIIQ